MLGLIGIAGRDSWCLPPKTPPRSVPNPTTPATTSLKGSSGPPPAASISANSFPAVSAASFNPVFTAFFVACFAIDLPTSPASFSAPCSIPPTALSSPCSNSVSGLAAGGSGFASNNCSFFALF